MSLPVRAHPAAKRELDEAADFYDFERLGLGSDFIDKVEHAVGPSPAAVLLAEPYRAHGA
jgi:hypothetical protein